MSYKCPYCKESFIKRAESFPFCSEKCQQSDLGKWATEAYTVPALETPTESEIHEQLEEKASANLSTRPH